MQITLVCLKSIIKQITLGLLYLHQKGFMHRDLKPENILINYLGEVKIADLAFISPVEKGMYTRYIATRWYRAPE